MRIQELNQTVHTIVKKKPIYCVKAVPHELTQTVRYSEDPDISGS